MQELLQTDHVNDHYATLKDDVSRAVRTVFPVDMLLSTVLNAVHRIQYQVHRNDDGRIKHELNVQNKRYFHSSIVSAFLKLSSLSYSAPCSPYR